MGVLLRLLKGSVGCLELMHSLGHVRGAAGKDHRDDRRGYVLLAVAGHGHMAGAHGARGGIGAWGAVQMARRRVARVFRAMRRAGAVHGNLRKVSRRQLRQLRNVSVGGRPLLVVVLKGCHTVLLIHDIANVHYLDGS